MMNARAGSVVVQSELGFSSTTAGSFRADAAWNLNRKHLVIVRRNKYEVLAIAMIKKEEESPWLPSWIAKNQKISPQLCKETQI